MLRRDAKKRSNQPLRLAACIGLVLFIMGTATLPVLAVDTQIGAKVCGVNPNGATINFTQPTNDSVVNQPVNTFRGTVESASQIVFEVDGVYNSTLAIAANQPDFMTDINLSTGTHTITATAIEVCGGSDAVANVVVTYEPSVDEPSSGMLTPTEVPDQQTLVTTGEIIDTSDSETSSLVQQIEQLPIIGAAVSVVSDFATAIGLQSTVISGNAPVATGVARVGVTVVALTSVVMASTLAPVAAQAIPGVSEIFNVSSHRSMIYLGWAIRGIGVLAMAFAYFI